MPIDIKSRIFNKQQERNKLDAELVLKKTYKNTNVIIKNNYNPDNIPRPKINNKNINKSDKILKDLKALGIIK